MIWILLILAVLLFFLIRFFVKHRFPPMGCVSLVTGAVKSGKSSYAVWLCVSTHFRSLVRTYIYNFFHRKNKKEIPYLYSNIPLKYKWCRKLTKELIMREVRFSYGSCIYVNEASLLADSKMWNDVTLNECLMLFNKLIGHEVGAGCLLCYDTQSLDDCHHAVVRCLGEYIHLGGKRKILGGILVQYRRMKLTSVGKSVDVNVFDGKDDEQPSVFIPSLVWRIFDAYCYSIITDDLPISAQKYNVKKGKNALKTREIVTLNKERERRIKEVEIMSKKKKEVCEDESKKILDI